MYNASVSLKYLIFTGASATRGAPTTIHSVLPTARAPRGDVPEKSQCSIHRLTVGKRARDVGFQEDEVLPAIPRR